MDRRDFMKAAAAGTAIVGAAAQAHAEDVKSTPTKFPFPIIDTHVHLYDPTRWQGVPWPDPVTQPEIYHRFLPVDYRKIAEPFGVVGLIETECSPWVEDNYWVLDIAANEQIVVGEVGDLVPGRADFTEHLTRLHKNPIYRGIRFSNLWGRNVTESLKDPQAITDLKLLHELDLSLDLSGGPEGIPNLMKITDAIPGIRIILNHQPGVRYPAEPAAYDAYVRSLREVARRNVYVKFSEIFHPIDEHGGRVMTGGRVAHDLNSYRPWLNEIWDTFGADRLMYASDWANSVPWSSFGQTVNVVHDFISQKDPSALEKVFWKNSCKGYKWPKRRADQPSLT